MSIFSDVARRIRNAVYGRDVQGAMADAMDAMDGAISSVEENAQKAEDAKNTLLNAVDPTLSVLGAPADAAVVGITTEETRNLFDRYGPELYAWLNGDGRLTSDNGGTKARTAIVRVAPNTKYFIKNNTDRRIAVAQFDSMPATGGFGNTVQIQMNGSNGLLCTTRNTTNYLAVYHHSSSWTLEQLEESYRSLLVVPDEESHDFIPHRSAVDYSLREIVRNKHPQLSAVQKSALKRLMDDYYAHRDIFTYEYNHYRNAYSDAARAYDANNGKFILNCVGFAQMIIMGRSITDYINSDGTSKGTGYSPAITKVFDFGYYADFVYHSIVANLAVWADNTTVQSYYGFSNPDNRPDYTGSFSWNSFYSPGSTQLYKQNFNQYMNANDLAFELHRKGCEIQFDELDVGDLIFCKHYNDPSEGSAFARSAYRNITHVAIVYGRFKDGTLAFMECGGIGKDPCIYKVSTSYSSNLDKTRAAYLEHNIVMCARLPIAFGIPSNVPDMIEYVGNAYGN